ncbi:hypothetical protein [Caldisalinibacter kiritimatiensis]|uniref:Lipoprotein n=1 Tax=Caldisalinibacter kiritimatiensis TaxID=1304284 RepID=R1ATP5_9FIRM|nr:hypothetical protein [Caldisalinibacter kiritimatiensis]EOC99996.1 hypothetical protein L21TH_1964 [Caldisalinibacter kiritimatiensis]
MQREKIWGNKFICLLSILLLTVLTTGCGKFPINNSVNEYSLDEYLKVNNYDYVLGTKIIVNENTEIKDKYKFKEREDTDKYLINELLTYFNSFEYIEDENVTKGSNTIYEFKFKNNSSYERIIIQVKSNREIDFIKFGGRTVQEEKRILMHLQTKKEKIDIDYIDELYNSLSREFRP